MTDDDTAPQPGTAQAARIRKAGCGIRFEDGELQEGIDFSAAAGLKPTDDAPSANGEDRQPDAHP